VGLLTLKHLLLCGTLAFLLRKSQYRKESTVTLEDDPRNMFYIHEVLVYLVESARDAMSQGARCSLSQQPPCLPSSHAVCSAGLCKLV